MASTRDAGSRAGTTNERLRLAGIDVENYKSLDSLHLDFVPPSTSDELDAYVLGSRNGVGKSSLLECCALAVIALQHPEVLKWTSGPRTLFDPSELLIRSGANTARIQAKILSGRKHKELNVELTKNGFTTTIDKKPIGGDAPRRRESPLDVDSLLDSLLGFNSEPLIASSLLLFHSYRKVVEGSSSLGAMLDPAQARRTVASRLWATRAGPLSTFKVILVQALMARSGLFEGVKSQGDNKAILEKLNSLIEDFAGGRVDKLRPGQDGTLELRVAPIKGGASFSFDGLSSGQKEIIATLFLIWYTTRDKPSIVLIDEPELHLNAEWQRMFVHRLAELAPNNQYILATHSEEIFASVSESHRIMLERG